MFLNIKWTLLTVFFSRFLSANIVFLSHSRSFCCPLTQPLTKKKRSLNRQSDWLFAFWVTKKGEKNTRKNNQAFADAEMPEPWPLHMSKRKGKRKKNFFLGFFLYGMHACSSICPRWSCGWLGACSSYCW